MNKKNIQIKLVTFFIIILFLSGLQAQDLKKVAQSGMQYLKVGVDAQMVGRGDAGITLSEGLASTFWNPAGLAELEGQEVLFSHNAWIADISMDAFGYGINLSHWGTIAINAFWVDYGTLRATSVPQSVEGTNSFGYVDEGTFNPIDLAIGITYARKISSQFSIGGQVRYLYEYMGSNIIVNDDGDDVSVDNRISAFSFDLGTRYHTGYKSLVISMTVQNFAPDMKYQFESFSPPLTFKMGMSMDLLDFTNNKSRSKWLLAIDAIHPRDYTERINIGTEYDLLGRFQLRGGYRLNYDIASFSLGGGIRHSLKNGIQMRLDMSYLTMKKDSPFTEPIQMTIGIKF